jgi:syntaxin 6
VETNIQKVADLLGSYNRLKSSDAATVAETVDDLETAIELLDLDLQDLDECVRVVEDHGDRWGIGDAEVRDRRAFVKRITRDVDVSTAVYLCVRDLVLIPRH